MTAKLQALPTNIMDGEFTPDSLHPADLEQVIIAAYDVYQELQAGKEKRQYRIRCNQLVDMLSEKRGFKQFSHL